MNGMLDEQTRNYLENFKKEIKQALEEALQNMKELVNLNIDNVKESISTLKKQSEEHYTAEKKNSTDILLIQGRVSILEDDKQDKKHNTGTIIAIVGLVITAIIAAIGWLR